MAVATFGVTPLSLGQVAQGLTFSETSTPSIAGAQSVIERKAQRWIGHAYGYGSTVLPTDPESTEYGIGQEWITYAAAADILAARERAPLPLVERLQEQADKVWESVVAHPQDLGANRPSGSTSPNIPDSHAQHPDTVSDATFTNRSLLERMAIVGEI